MRVIFVFLLTLGIHTTTALAQSTGGFTTTGNMVAARYGHTATLLLDGRVLFAGGRTSDNSILASAELYDPAAGTFSATGDMTAARYWPYAALLPDGRVFIAGGAGKDGPLASAEIYDPSSGVFTAAANLPNAQDLLSATLLGNGKVLVLASLIDTGVVAALYDASTQTFTTGNGPGTWGPQNSTLLPDGRVFFDAGTDLQGTFYGAQLYDPATGMFTTVGNLPPEGSCCGFWNSATLLNNGDVLLAGGGNGDWGLAFASAALYDHTSGTLIPTGSMANTRFGHKASLLPDGTVLITGGAIGCPPQGGFCGGYVNAAEIYNPSTGAFRPAGSMAMARELHTSTLLGNGAVLIAGGAGGGTTAELYSPALWQSAPSSFVTPRISGR